MIAQFSAEVQALLEQARGKTPAEAIHALRRMDTDESRHALREALDSLRGTRWYWSIVRYLTKHDAIDLLPVMGDAFRETLPNSNRNLRNHRYKTGAKKFLRELPTDAAVDVVEGLLHNALDQTDVLVCIETLANSKSDKAIYLLARLMTEHPQRPVRLRATYQLGQTRNPRGLTSLMNLIETQTDRGLRHNAMEAILAIVSRSQPLSPGYKTRLLQIFKRLLYETSDTSLVAYLHRLNMPEANIIAVEWEDQRESDSELSFFR